MKERPILFNGAMVRAILEGRKTQTRRIVKPQWANDAEPAEVPATSPEGWQITGHSGLWWDDAGACFDDAIRCPYGQPGDRLWVREKFQPLFADGVEWRETNWETGKGYAISYPATDGIQEFVDPDDNITDACKPSIHMPRWASRITLEITGVRVERLTDISEADGRAEGCCVPEIIYPDEPRDSYSYVSAYRHLWESINGAGSWESNPWVWVVEFKQIGGAA